MGRRGPLPKPTAIKIAAGNPGKRRLNDGEPVPPVGEISPPAWLSRRARRVWNEVAPVCAAMRTLTTADVYTFGRYCEAFARWLLVKAKFDHDDDDKAFNATTYPMKTEGGKVRCIIEWPQKHELKRLHQELKELEDRFGLSPAARSRIRVELIAAAVPAQPAAPLQMPGGELADYLRRRGVLAKVGAGAMTEAGNAG